MVIKIKRKYIFFVISIILALLIILPILNYISTLNKVDAINEDDVLLPIIMYHEMKTNKLGKDVISPYEFETDLKYLKENNFNTITMNDLIDYVYNNKSLPDKPIILSFDDGYLNTYHYAFPLLKKYNMKMVFSIIGKNTNDFTDIPDKNLDYSHITWAQLKEMTDTGLVEVQNHTYNLHNNNKNRMGCVQKARESFSTYEQLLKDDINKLQDKIISTTGNTPSTFTYPYGRFNENTDVVIKNLGFKATLSCKYGINKISTDPNDLYGLKRICRSSGTSINKYLKNVYKTIKFTK